jgi:hypothetical protein
MTRLVVVVGVAAVVSVGPVAAQRGVRTITAPACAAALGDGVKSKRAFCDVLIGKTPASSVSVTIPRYTGTATLRFDLHNRFTVPAIALPGSLTYARHEALVTVIRATGEPVGRAAVVREFRAPADLFDQIGGGAHPGGVKAVAPGPPESVRVVLPAGLAAVGVVGTRLTVLTRVKEEVFDTPGRPVAILSNLRLEYRPR